MQIEFAVVKGLQYNLYNGKYNGKTEVGLPEPRTDWIFLE